MNMILQLNCVPALKSLPYEDRLKKLNLTTYEVRRIRGDILEVFKILILILKVNE